MTQSPFHVAPARSGTCFECGRSLDVRPFGVKLRLVEERTLGTVVLCRECFGRAIAAADRSSTAVPEVAPVIRRECKWTAPAPSTVTCSNTASFSARAVRKDGSTVADLALCDEHLAAFKTWWHDHAITVQRLSVPQESA